MEGYQGWFGSIRSGCEVFFFATSLVCVFFSTACQQKRGLHWCLFLLYQATTTLNRQIVCFCLSIQRRFLQIHVENIALLRIFPFFCVAGLQQMPPQRIPHYYPAAQTTEKIRSPQRFSRTFPRIPPVFRFAYIQICSIDPKTKCA